MLAPTSEIQGPPVRQFASSWTACTALGLPCLTRIVAELSHAHETLLDGPRWDKTRISCAACRPARVAQWGFSSSWHRRAEADWDVVDVAARQGRTRPESKRTKSALSSLVVSAWGGWVAVFGMIGPAKRSRATWASHDSPRTPPVPWRFRGGRRPSLGRFASRLGSLPTPGLALGGEGGQALRPAEGAGMGRRAGAGWTWWTRCSLITRGRASDAMLPSRHEAFLQADRRHWW